MQLPVQRPGQGPLSLDRLVELNLELREQATRSRAKCSKPWTTLEEREDFHSRVPDDITSCCWLHRHHGKANTGEEVLALWRSPSVAALRAEMSKGSTPAACPADCPVLQDRGEWFEKQEFFAYTKDELRGFSVAFLDNRRRALEAVLGISGDAGLWPTRLKIFPSNECNLRCNMCPIDFETKVQRTWYEGPSFASMLPYLEELLVFGAEPFACETSRGLLLGEGAAPQTHFSFITNGTLVTESAVEALSAKRLGAVDVSLDSPRKDVYERIRIRGKFEHAVRGARLLATLGRTHPLRRFRVFAGFAIQDLNYRLLPEFVFFCAELGVEANPAMAFPTKASKVRERLYGYTAADIPNDVPALLHSLESAADAARQAGQLHALGRIEALSALLLDRMGALT
ncbi:MAG TPA: radical SAM protein [Myxococcales bacterium]